MARFSTVYNRSGRQTMQDIYNLFDNLNKERERKGFYNNILNAWNEYQKGQQNLPKEVNLSNITELPSQMENIKIGEENIQMQQPSDFMLPNALTGQKAYEQSQTNYDKLLNSFIPQILSGRINENQIGAINLLSQLAEQQTGRLKPQVVKPEIQAFNPEYDLYDVSSGKLIKSGIEKPKEKEDIFLGVRKIDGRQGYAYGYKDDNNNEVIKTFKEIEPRGTGGGKELPDVSKQLGSVNQTIKSIDNLKNNAKYDKDKNEYTVNMFDKNGRMIESKLTPDQFRNQIELRKQKAVGDITQVIQKRDLQDAIDTIRSNIMERTNLDIKDINFQNIEKEINGFLKNNPDYIDDKPYIVAYFKLFKQ